jgi:hypothetical protein
LGSEVGVGVAVRADVGVFVGGSVSVGAGVGVGGTGVSVGGTGVADGPGVVAGVQATSIRSRSGASRPTCRKRRFTVVIRFSST